jgi:hypothetical protein
LRFVKAKYGLVVGEDWTFENGCCATAGRAAKNSAIATIPKPNLRVFIFEDLSTVLD